MPDLDPERDETKDATGAPLALLKAMARDLFAEVERSLRTEPVPPAPPPAKAALPPEPSPPPQLPAETYSPAPRLRVAPTLRLPAPVYLLLAAQVLATLLLGAGLWRLLSQPPQGPVVPPPPHEVLQAPGLELEESVIEQTDALHLHGTATGFDFVALSLDGRLHVFAPVLDGRFTLPAFDIAAGAHTLAVIAYKKTGEAVRSAPRELRVTRPPEPTPAAAVKPTPIARSARLKVPVESRAHSSPGRARPVNIVRGARGKHIALTFDGGSSANQADTILATLKARGVRSTVFLTGEFIAAHPDLTRRIIADGHEVGNHTLTHPHLADWKDGRGHVTRAGVTRAFLLGQLQETERRFKAATGRDILRYWRAPYGEVNQQILRWAEEAGWTHIGWTQGLDTLDWVADKDHQLYRTAPEIRDRILTAATATGRARGGIVLMHLGSERSGDEAAGELQRIIDGLRNEGYRLVTVSKLLATS